MVFTEKIRRNRTCHFLINILEIKQQKYKQSFRFNRKKLKTKEFWDLESNLHNYLVEEMKKNPIEDREKEREKDT